MRHIAHDPKMRSLHFGSALFGIENQISKLIFTNQYWVNILPRVVVQYNSIAPNWPVFRRIEFDACFQVIFFVGLLFFDLLFLSLSYLWLFFFYYFLSFLTSFDSCGAYSFLFPFLPPFPQLIYCSVSFFFNVLVLSPLTIHTLSYSIFSFEGTLLPFLFMLWATIILILPFIRNYRKHSDTIRDERVFFHSSDTTTVSVAIAETACLNHVKARIMKTRRQNRSLRIKVHQVESRFTTCTL